MDTNGRSQFRTRESGKVYAKAKALFFKNSIWIKT